MNRSRFVVAQRSVHLRQRIHAMNKVPKKTILDAKK